MQITYAFIIAMIGFSLFFVSVYFFNYPLEQTSSVFKEPYFLSIRPDLVSKNGTVEVFFSSLNGRGMENNSIAIFDPSGDMLHHPIGSTENRSFIFSKTSFLGNYSVILESKDNHSLASVNFKVVPNAPLYAFINFAFGKGIPLTIGLAVIVISTVFQFAFTRNSDRNRQYDEKSKWAIDNAKYFVKLSIYSGYISECFTKTEHGIVLDPKRRYRLLTNIVVFLENYYEYLDKLGFYYFHDYSSEDFAARLDTSIIRFYDCIFSYLTFRR